MNTYIISSMATYTYYSYPVNIHDIYNKHILHWPTRNLNTPIWTLSVNTYSICLTLIEIFLVWLHRRVSFLQLIFSGEYTKAMDKDWHSGHFCCWQCDESLTGQRYVIRDDHPYCIKCYENVFANTCEECNKIIGIDSKVSLAAGTILNKRWKFNGKYII